MSAREQQLERELEATRELVRARASGYRGKEYELENVLDYLRAQHSREAAVLAWRPYDE